MPIDPGDLAYELREKQYAFACRLMAITDLAVGAWAALTKDGYSYSMFISEYLRMIPSWLLGGCLIVGGVLRMSSYFIKIPEARAIGILIAFSCYGVALIAAFRVDTKTIAIPVFGTLMLQNAILLLLIKRTPHGFG